MRATKGNVIVLALCYGLAGTLLYLGVQWIASYAERLSRVTKHIEQLHTRMDNIEKVVAY